MTGRHTQIAVGLMARAEARLQNDDRDGAKTVCDQALRENPRQADALHLSARLAYAAGDLDTAIRKLRRAIELVPESSLYIYDLALALQAAGMTRAALACFRKTLQIDPRNWEAHFYCGVIEQESGNTDAAMSHYRCAIGINPEVAEAHNNLGCLKRKLEDFPAACACFEKAVKLLPDFTEAWNNLSDVHQRCGVWARAVDCLRQIRELQPENPDIHIRLGDVFKKAGDMPKAVVKYQQALGLKPSFALAHFKLGLCYADSGEHARAIGHYRSAIELRPDSAEPYINLGNLYAKQDRLIEAVTCYRKAIHLKPASAQPYYYLGCVLRDLGQLPQSLIATRKALEIDPDYAEARFSLALTLLLAGDLDHGWQAYEARMQLKDSCGDYPYLDRCPLWDGQAFPGKTLLVQSEQGFGDILQFVRFMPMVKQLGGRVILETYDSLLELLRSVPGIDRLHSNAGDTFVHDEIDLYIPLLSLPRCLGTCIDTIPADMPYLFAAEDKKQSWRQRIAGKGFKVGIVWAGNPEYSKDKSRSCRLRFFEGISRITGVRLYGLQKEVAPADRSLSVQLGIILLGDAFQDFSDTAAAIHHMDLVISVDTSVAHLAAAMGKPTWILLPMVPDFRWLMQRDDSPWYPTARLYRQEKRGDWTGVMQKLADDLSALVRQ